MKIAVLGSTRGTSLQPIIDTIERGELDASIQLAISNKTDAYILERARNCGLPALYLDSAGKTREEFDALMANELRARQIDLVLLIGWMRLLSPSFVEEWSGRVWNVHPSLLPAFAGLMDLEVHKAVLAAGARETGCTIHEVDEGTDTGPIILQKKCPVEVGDTPETLKAKVQALEGEAFIEAIKNYCAMNFPIKPTRALISVSDKTGVADLARELSALGVQIISTGGTRRAIAEAGVAVTDISVYTGFPEIMDGRVKTLHPRVHGGILGRRDAHAAAAAEHGIGWIDLVACNLYPFAETIARPGIAFEEAVEDIDIGGPSMVRAAAKNTAWTIVLVDPADYAPALAQIRADGMPLAERKRLAAKAFNHTARYDQVIADYLSLRGVPQCDIPRNYNFPDALNLTFKKHSDLRYGENPHQTAVLYRAEDAPRCSIVNARILQGKRMSYNNINDADAALSALKEFSEPACVVAKHANPCGVAEGSDMTEVYERAYNADSLSAFGGVIAMNRKCVGAIAERLSSVFAEIVLAPSYEPAALELFAQKKNLRVLELPVISSPAPHLEYRSVEGGLLAQDADIQALGEADIKIVTQKSPLPEEIRDMLFAWKAIKHVKSNAILLAKNQTTVGIGAGQVSRVDAVDIALKKAGENAVGCVLASDAFFPFRDSIDRLAGSGVTAVIQPGGSVRDQEVIGACNELGIAMVATGVRCFRH